jgi:hypothetical protein
VDFASQEELPMAERTQHAASKHHRPAVGEQEAAAPHARQAIPGEVLVADARGNLTPSQMVEQKLLALLGCGHPGLYRQATGSLGNIRRLAGK